MRVGGRKSTRVREKKGKKRSETWGNSLCVDRSPRGLEAREAKEHTDKKLEHEKKAYYSDTTQGELRLIYSSALCLYGAISR